MQSQSRRTFVTSAACLLLLLFGLQIVLTIHQESLTWDEGDHIFAGYMTWKTHDYGLNPEHPPMMKMLATIPLLGLPLKVPELKGRYFKDEAYLDGRDLLFNNAPAYTAETLTFRVRLMTVLVSILLALLVFLCAQEMFGPEAGLLALALVVFEPNILAHGAFVTTDAAVSCFFLASIYAFYRYCKVPSAGRLVVAGIAVGLALAAKHSAVLVFPMLAILAACEVAFQFKADESRGRRAARLAGALVGMTIIAVAVLWVFYGLRYDARPAGMKLDPSLAEYVGGLKSIEGRGILFLARFHILPESYLYGLADVRAMANGMPSYFFGKVYNHGVWFYFPAVITIKETLGLLVLGALACAAVATGRLRRWREILFLVVPPLFYLLVAMKSHLNIGARHILPIFVFLCVFAAGGSWAWIQSPERTGLAWSRRWASVVGVLLLMHVGSSAKAYPSYMAYSNELWGGPSKTYKYLTDSNTDWAQQLLAVKRYTDENNVKDCWFAYFADPFLRAQDYGIPCKPLPTPDSYFTRVQHPVPLEIKGPVLISAGTLTGFEYGSNVLNPYRQFQELKPSAMIQNGVLVFEGTYVVPLASALSHVQQSAALLKQNQHVEALAEAQEAVSIAPEALQPRIALGDALKAAGKKDEAREAYGQALPIVQTMEPGARQDWNRRIQNFMAAQ